MLVSFVLGMMATALAEDELLLEARLPLLAPDTRFGFYEFSRRAGDYALAMALVTFRLQDGAIVAPRIGIGGAEARPRRMAAAEAVLAGRRPDAESFRAAAEAAADVIRADGRYPCGRRIPARRGARRDAAGARTGARMNAPTKGSGLAWVGRAIRRVEDPALLAGRGRFTGDLPATLRVRFVRSPVAAGRIERIAIPEGANVVTAADLAAVKPIMPALHKFGYVPIAQPVLASGCVRFVGEPIAAVVAASEAQAEDIVDTVSVDIAASAAVIDAQGRDAGICRRARRGVSAYRHRAALAAPERDAARGARRPCRVRSGGRAAFKERIHGRRRRGVGVERAPRRLTCRGDSAAIWPAIVASSRRRSASSRAVSLFASSAMRASHSASASGVMRLIRVPGISSSLGPRPRFFNLCTCCARGVWLCTTPEQFYP